jgi:uncharacterized membrane protein
MQALLITLHVLAAVIWVGGMIFAYAFQRPAAVSELEAPERLRLWVATFRGFFPWVWAAVVVLPLTGYAYIFRYFGGMAQTPLYGHLMSALGLLMIAIYLHVFFAPYRKLQAAVAREDWAEGGRQLGRIRRAVGINLAIGVVVIAIAVAGKRGFWLLG